MKILSVYFNRNGAYRPLRKVFEASARRFMPDASIEILELPMPRAIDHKRDTSTAFIAAAERVLEDNVSVAVCDIDLMFRGSIEPAMDATKAIGITTRESFKHPYNTGVWFFRPGLGSREFIYKWVNETKRLVRDFDAELEYILEHGGIDQAALDAVIKRDPNLAHVARFDCMEYNAEQSCWAGMTEKTRVVHIKSGLRIACLTGRHVPKFVAQWPDSEEREATVAEFRRYLDGK